MISLGKVFKSQLPSKFLEGGDQKTVNNIDTVEYSFLIVDLSHWLGNRNFSLVLYSLSFIHI